MSNSFRRALIVGLIAGCILLVLLVIASQNTVFFEKYYQLVLWSNSAITLLLASLVGYLVYRILRNAKDKKFGVKILGKFAMAMGLAGILPGLLIFIVSVQFLYGSVDSWFDVKVEKALDSGLTLSREVLESYQSSLSAKAKSFALEISETPPSQWITKLHDLREREGYSEAMLITTRGNVLGVSASSFNTLLPTVPANRILQVVRSQGYWGGLEEQENGGILAKAVVLVPTVELPTVRLFSSPFAYDGDKLGNLLGNQGDQQSKIQTSEGVYLEVAANIPPTLAHNSDALMTGYRDYQEMVLARSGLRTIYFVGLMLVLLISVSAAMALSLITTAQISKPLLLLYEGTRRVGEGKYEMVPESKSNDEVGELTKSFNIMTKQLAQAREDIEKRGQELVQANDYLGLILSKMSSGVIVIDDNLKIISVNPSASRILRINLFKELGNALDSVLPSFTEQIKDQLTAMLHDRGDGQDISVQAEVTVSDKKKHKLSLFIRGTELSAAETSRILLVFDDVTSMVVAQRTEAWGEVARRLAHEIKNPLTPIQLAAERLQMKLTGKVAGKEDEILQKATKTIVSQVTAMKQMVDDFRIYAKIGSPKYQEVNLSVFVEEVMSLYVAAGLKVQLDLDSDVPMINADENQLRQAVHNLVSNSMEAAPQGVEPRIFVKVDAVRNQKTGHATAVAMTVWDNGSGFSSEVLEHAFEPYVTTKSSGTGLGLAMIKKIVDEHGGNVTVENVVDEKGEILGAKVTLIFTQLVQSKE